MEKSFFIFPLIPFFLMFLFLFFRARYKWNKGQKLLSSLNLNDFKKIKNLRIGSDSHKGWKTIWGFTIDAVMYINDNSIVFVPAKWSIALAHTELPNWIERINKIFPYEINIKTPNEISIKHKNQTLHLGECTIEYVIKTKNNQQKKEIVEALKNWC